MKKSLKKLQLHRETVQNLDHWKLDRIAAGAANLDTGSECTACGKICIGTQTFPL